MLLEHLKATWKPHPVFHWTNQQAREHVATCFLAYPFLNYLRNTTRLSQRQIAKAPDATQLPEVKEDQTEKLLYMRSKVSEDQQTIARPLKLVVPRDLTTQSIINQIFNLKAASGKK